MHSFDSTYPTTNVIKMYSNLTWISLININIWKNLIMCHMQKTTNKYFLNSMSYSYIQINSSNIDFFFVCIFIYLFSKNTYYIGGVGWLRWSRDGNHHHHVHALCKIGAPSFSHGMFRRTSSMWSHWNHAWPCGIVTIMSISFQKTLIKSTSIVIVCFLGGWVRRTLFHRKELMKPAN